MEMRRPTEQHRKLEYFCGIWEGDETLFPSPWTPKEVKATGRFSTRMLDGFFLLSDYEQKRGGQISFSGHGVYGWDPSQDKYTMHWFDSMGFDPGAAVLGTWKGNKLCFQRQSKLSHSRYCYVIESKDRYSFSLLSSKDGEDWATFMQGTYTRS